MSVAGQFIARRRTGEFVRGSGLNALDAPCPTAPIIRRGRELLYCMTGSDCLRAAVATAAQIPFDQLPDARVDERLDAGGDPDDLSRASWVQLQRWLVDHGFALGWHDNPPVERRRWIGVCRIDRIYAPRRGRPTRARGTTWRPGTPFTDHCLVMSYDRVVFDPAISIRPPQGMKLRTWSLDDVAYGLSIDRKD